MYGNAIFKRFIKRKVSIFGLVVLAIFFFTALLGPLL